MDNPKLDSVLFYLKQLREDVEEVKLILTGNGAPHNGMVVRMDRAEQFIASAKRFVWLLIGAALTPGVVMAVIQHFMKGK